MQIKSINQLFFIIIKFYFIKLIEIKSIKHNFVSGYGPHRELSYSFSCFYYFLLLTVITSEKLYIYIKYNFLVLTLLQFHRTQPIGKFLVDVGYFISFYLLCHVTRSCIYREIPLIWHISTTLNMPKFELSTE